MIRAQLQYIVDRFGVQVVQTWGGIADALGKSPRTVKYYAKLRIDPLPVQREQLSRVVWIEYSELVDWARRRGIGVAT